MNATALCIIRYFIFKIQSMSQRQDVGRIEQKPEDQEISEMQASQQERPKIRSSPEEIGNQEIRISQIVKSAGGSQKKEQPAQISVITHVQPPVVKNPVFLYKGPQKYNWDIQMLDATACLQKIQGKIYPEIEQFPFMNDVQATVKGPLNLKGHIHYSILVKDRNGERQVARRFSEFTLWRSKLTERWPCLFLAALPNKTLMGASQVELIRSRSKYINRFLRSLSKHQQLYYSQQSQNFWKDSPDFNLQAYLSGLAPLKSLQILEKYKTVFHQQYTFSQREEFMYRKDQVPAILAQYQAYFTKKKIDLSDYQMNVKRMAESKQNYFRAASRLNQTLLPDYEDILYRWIYGQALPKQPPSIMQRVSFKQLKKSLNIADNQTQPQGQTKDQQSRQPSKEPSKEPQITRFGLYSSQAYKARLQDTALLIHDYNNSSQLIYDTIKSELKEIDSVYGAIQQAKSVHREIQYIQRTITINKEQVQSLNSNKTTLKTFFMQGSKDDKKSKLVNQSQVLQEQLQKLKQLYYLLMVLLEKQLVLYHKQRADFYRNSLTKAFSDELGIARTIMDFHIYEEQLFAKELGQRLHLLIDKEEPVQKQQEEIRQ